MLFLYRYVYIIYTWGSTMTGGEEEAYGFSAESAVKYVVAYWFSAESAVK